MIIEFLKNNIIGGLGDQVAGFISLSDRKLLGAPFNNNSLNLLENNQPIFSLLYNGGSQLFNSVLFANLFSIFSLILLFVFSYILFRYLKINKFISFLLSILITFSPYMYLHLGVHPALMQVWMIPAGIILLLKSKTLKQQIITGFFIAFAIFVSNYIGYFLLLFDGCFLLATVINKLIFDKLSWNKLGVVIIKYMVIFATALLISISALSSYFESSYKSTSTFNSGVNRTLEDFQNFSGRPWYLALPPIQNPIFGGVTKSVLNWMKNDWGYFLADDYFNGESPEMFLGLANIVIFAVAMFYFFTKGRRRERSRVAFTFALTGFLLFLFTFPPYFDFAGHKIYTLGWVLYKLFPMFRVTQRLGVAILMCVLIVNGVFLSAIKCKQKIILFLIVGCGIITLAEFYIPVTTTNVKTTPPIYEYLSRISHDEIIATYPSQSAEDIFWITKHEKGLINPRNYENSEYGFNSTEFTKWLPTLEGLAEARKYGVSYIVFSKTDLQKEMQADMSFIKSPNPEKFFRENLTLEKDFGDILLFTLSAR